MISKTLFTKHENQPKFVSDVRIAEKRPSSSTSTWPRTVSILEPIKSTNAMQDIEK